VRVAILRDAVLRTAPQDKVHGFHFYLLAVMSFMESLHRRPRMAMARARQNFTCGGVCAPSPAVNSAIGLLLRKTVAAHNRPGKVLRVVLYVRTASM
jgi:hypothetical protein